MSLFDDINDDEDIFGSGSVKVEVDGEDEILQPLDMKELLATPLSPQLPTPLANGDEEGEGEGEGEEFELIQSEEAPPPEEAERQLQLIEEEAEKRRQLEQEDKERQEREEAETTDGGMFTKLTSNRSNTDHDFDPLASPSPSPPISDSEDITEQQSQDDPKVTQLEKDVEELKMTAQQYKAETVILREKIAALERELAEEKDKNMKLEVVINEKDAEITTLKESAVVSKPPTGRKISGSKSSIGPGGSAGTSSVASPRTSAKLDRKSTASVAETAKKFGGVTEGNTTSATTKPSTLKPSTPPKRVSVTSKPEKPEKVTQKESPSKQTTGSSSSPTVKKERKTSSSSSQESSSTGGVAASKREAAEKAAAARTQPKAQDTSSKSSPPKPQRNRDTPGTKATPESSPQMSGGQGRSALDAIKMWEQKSSSKTPSAPEESPKKAPLVNQFSAPVIPINDENMTTQEEEEEKIEEEPMKEESTENVPPPTTSTTTSSTSDLEKEGEESKVSLREKPVGARGVTTQSVIVRGGPAAKRWGPVLEKCQVCGKTVYQQERLQADAKVYHKTCFRCTHCKKVVGLGNYAGINGETYCKTHFKMLFKIKGNYDEGFGRSQHKAKWASKQDSEPEPQVATATQ